VAGSALVGNRVNMITRFQALEYVTNQNLDRRALEVVNGITVVPGAIGAWRRDALLSIGGFCSDTLAEDADATVRLALGGWRIIYEPAAVALTEAPETVSAFLKQRRRWMFGLLQVAYKNRAVVLRGRPVGVGLFGLPNILIFQFCFILIAPIIDLALIIYLAAAMTTPGAPVDLSAIAAYWLGFQLLDLATAGLAVTLDRRPDLWRLLPLLVLQRFCYRQLLYLTALRVNAAAINGRMLGWGKLTRTAHVAHKMPV
jgi:cellulose synthase/poly-beta-1,6-N-acetylglucosamine synthase-like glycosyltransferase